MKRIGDQIKTALRLRPFALEEERLLNAVERGYRITIQVTSRNFPACVKGAFRWGKIIESLAEELVASGQGWELRKSENFNYLINPQLKLCIAVRSGDARTGTPLSPKTKNLAGKKIAAAVDGVKVMALPGFEPPAPVWDDCVLYLLLHYQAEGSDVVHVELSRPIGRDTEGRVIFGDDRIILRPIDLGPEPTLARRLADSEEIPKYEVTVTKKE